MTLIEQIDATMSALRHQVNALQREMHQRLDALPEPSPDLGALLEELGAAAKDREEHHAVRYPGDFKHPHNRCIESGEAQCESCADWNRVYLRYELAATAMVRYARALRSKATKDA